MYINTWPLVAAVEGECGRCTKIVFFKVSNFKMSDPQLPEFPGQYQNQTFLSDSVFWKCIFVSSCRWALLDWHTHLLTRPDSAMICEQYPLKPSLKTVSIINNTTTIACLRLPAIRKMWRSCRLVLLWYLLRMTGKWEVWWCGRAQWKVNFIHIFISTLGWMYCNQLFTLEGKAFWLNMSFFLHWGPIFTTVLFFLNPKLVHPLSGAKTSPVLFLCLKCDKLPLLHNFSCTSSQDQITVLDY